MTTGITPEARTLLSQVCAGRLAFLNSHPASPPGPLVYAEKGPESPVSRSLAHAQLISAVQLSARGVFRPIPPPHAYERGPVARTLARHAHLLGPRPPRTTSGDTRLGLEPPDL